MLKGAEIIVGRPGASLEPLDFGALEESLEETHGAKAKEVDVMSAALYPKVCGGFQRKPFSLPYIPNKCCHSTSSSLMKLS